MEAAAARPAAGEPAPAPPAVPSLKKSCDFCIRRKRHCNGYSGGEGRQRCRCGMLVHAAALFSFGIANDAFMHAAVLHLLLCKKKFAGVGWISAEAAANCELFCGKGSIHPRNERSVRWRCLCGRPSQGSIRAQALSDEPLLACERSASHTIKLVLPNLVLILNSPILIPSAVWGRLCVSVFPIYFGDGSPSDQGNLCASLRSVFRGLHFFV